jgi:hypothetical protein
LSLFHRRVLTSLVVARGRIQHDNVRANAQQLRGGPSHTGVLTVLVHFNLSVHLHAVHVKHTQKVVVDARHRLIAPHVHRELEVNVELATETISLARADKGLVTLTPQSQHEMQAITCDKTK